jgi:FkbM family methyltransferase
MAFLLERYLGRRREGAFVEIGGFDGVHASNTWGLAERGWHGLYVEPVPQFAESCRTHHQAHPAVDVLELAVAAPGCDAVDLTVAGALTTGSDDLAQAYRETAWSRDALAGALSLTVPAVTADAALESWLPSAGGTLDVLVIDVEGMESEVFAGLSLHRWLPTMLIVELMDNHPDFDHAHAPSAQLYAEILAQGYVVVYKTSLNTVFVERSCWERVTGVGPHVLPDMRDGQIENRSARLSE